MNEKENKNVAVKTVSNIVQKTAGAGKKIAINTKQGFKNTIERAKEKSHQKKLKRLNPVFPEQYNSLDFHLPNVIMIVDDATRKNEKLCEGAIGYLENNSNVEIFCLYDEAVAFSKIQFVPNAVCDATYCVDPYDRNRFIRSDCFFNKAHEEKLAELKHIAHCLGAKKCSIEISESTSASKEQSRRAEFKGEYQGSSIAENTESSFLGSQRDARSGTVEIEFAGNSNCKTPTLKWFANEDTIKRLIEMRMTDSNAVLSETLKISGSSTASMSQKTAAAIDGAVGKASVSLSEQAKKEYNSTLIYRIQF
ncbi:MAG: hypothetical protein E7413_06345 [Ruminococcaceae bacterium]|nr:hypothetical protein [Oscillospiraceae bacterium]